MVQHGSSAGLGRSCLKNGDQNYHGQNNNQALGFSPCSGCFPSTLPVFEQRHGRWPCDASSTGDYHTHFMYFPIHMYDIRQDSVFDIRAIRA